MPLSTKEESPRKSVARLPRGYVTAVKEDEDEHGRFAVPGQESHESEETLGIDERDDDDNGDEPPPGTPVEPKEP